jgi:hypothetical protein
MSVPSKRSQLRRALAGVMVFIAVSGSAVGLGEEAASARAEVLRPLNVATLSGSETAAPGAGHPKESGRRPERHALARRRAEIRTG